MYLRKLTGLAIAVSLALPAAAAATYDNLNDETLGDTPYRSPKTIVLTASFDSSGFTNSADELAFPAGLLVCNNVWGAKTAWVRWNTALAGRLAVHVNSEGHSEPGDDKDVYYYLYRAPPGTPPGAAQPFTLPPNAEGCMSERVGVANELYTFQGGHDIAEPGLLYLQVNVVCQTGEDGPQYRCDDTEIANNAKGGPTIVTLTFDPYAGDADGDEIADPVDTCPALFAPSTAEGCPGPPQDRDADGALNNDSDLLKRDCDDFDPNLNPGLGPRPGKTNCYDRDNDGFARVAEGGNDCDDTASQIRPGVKEEPDNAVDENCNAMKLIGADVSAGFSSNARRTIGFFDFDIERVPAGARIEIECHGDSDCPFASKRYSSKKQRRKLRVGKQFDEDDSLKPGARVEVAVTDAGFAGIIKTYTMRKRGRPKVTLSCLRPGSFDKRVPGSSRVAKKKAKDPVPNLKQC